MKFEIWNQVDSPDRQQKFYNEGLVVVRADAYVEETERGDPHDCGKEW